MSLRLYTVAYGDKYLDWFKRGLLPSLYFSKNRLALENANTTWVLITDKEEAFHRAQELFPNIKIECYLPRRPEQDIQSEIENCLRTKSPFLMAPPDTIFSNGAIPTLIEAGRQPKTVVGMVHTRVNPSFLDAIPSMTGAQLVSRAWEHLHRSWKWSEVKEFTNSNVGGVSWKKLSSHLVQVQHRLPTPYLVNFKPSDLEYFRHEQFSVWDHEWPTKLVNEERWRYIGSSDAAYAVEVTEERMNCAASEYTDPNEPDVFGRELSHNKLNRQVLAILRSERPFP